jgi:hypothetical protein
MSRVELPEPSSLPPYLRSLHDGARDGDWSTRHVARVHRERRSIGALFGLLLSVS